MRLPDDPHRLTCLSSAFLIRVIIKCRETLRCVRDQTGDDRCFLDYYLIWQLVQSSPPMPHFSAEEGMRRCVLFYENCRAETLDEIAPGTYCEIWRWDANLPSASRAQLAGELLRLERAIVRHRDIETTEGRPRNLDDDRELYRVTLPEQVPGDFRLPPREQFLVSETRDRGCPAFWTSHANCDPAVCNLHKWGPCEEDE